MKSDPFRRLAAFVVIVGVLFAQLAVAAFACPGPQSVDPAAAMTMDMSGCGMAPAQQESSPLCRAHCEQAAQAPDQHSPPLAAAAGFFEPIAFAVAWSDRSIGPRAPRAPPPILDRPAGPTVAVLHARLRI